MVDGVEIPQLWVDYIAALLQKYDLTAAGTIGSALLNIE